MAITANVQSISRIGSSDRVAIQVSFSDGSNKEFQFQLPIDKLAARAEIKAEVDRLNTLDGQVATLQTLIGTIIS